MLGRLVTQIKIKCGSCLGSFLGWRRRCKFLYTNKCKGGYFCCGFLVTLNFVSINFATGLAVCLPRFSNWCKHAMTCLTFRLIMALWLSLCAVASRMLLLCLNTAKCFPKKHSYLYPGASHRMKHMWNPVISIVLDGEGIHIHQYVDVDWHVYLCMYG